MRGNSAWRKPREREICICPRERLRQLDKVSFTFYCGGLEPFAFGASFQLQYPSLLDWVLLWVAERIGGVGAK